MATNFQDLVAKVKNLVALAPVLGAISHPDLCINKQRSKILKTMLFYRDQNNFNSETLISEYNLMDLPFHYILEVLRQVFKLVFHDSIHPW